MTGLRGPKKLDEAAIARELEEEARLDGKGASAYLRLLKEGSLPVSEMDASARPLIEKGMAIVSGDGKRIIPVHPRLGIANQYRTWREAMVRHINDRRMKVDRLILELIPVYEAAMEKKKELRGR